jgi:type II secretory pathway component PulM
MSNASMSSVARAGATRPQDRRALLIGATVLVVAIGYARLVRPAMNDLAHQRQTLGEQKALLARERSLLAVAPTLPRARSDAARALVAENTRLFSGDSVAATGALTNFVTDVAAATGVRLTTVEGRTPHSERGVTRLAVDVRGEGSWRQVLAFIHALEATARLVDVTSVRIERGARGGPLGGELVSVAATLSGYARSAP